MFPTTEQCRQYADGELQQLQDFDGRLREALIRARTSPEADGVKKALVTVLLSVAADAAMLTAPDCGTPLIEDFVEAARDAFQWSQRKIGNSPVNRS